MSREEPYITCRELIDFLDDYLSGELLPDRRHEFERHLAVCEACRNYIDQYSDSIRLGRAAFSLPAPHGRAPADAPEELIRAILAARM